MLNELQEMDLFDDLARDVIVKEMSHIKVKFQFWKEKEKDLKVGIIHHLWVRRPLALLSLSLNRSPLFSSLLYLLHPVYLLIYQMVLNELYLLVSSYVHSSTSKKDIIFQFMDFAYHNLSRFSWKSHNRDFKI